MPVYVLILLIIFGMLCFILGILLSEYRHNERFLRKQDRRNSLAATITRQQRKRYNWDNEHPKELPRGQCIFKGGADRMSAEEFKTALQNTVVVSA